jgi:hypothetical protein
MGGQIEGVLLQLAAGQESPLPTAHSMDAALTPCGSPQPPLLPIPVPSPATAAAVPAVGRGRAREPGGALCCLFPDRS